MPSPTTVLQLIRDGLSLTNTVGVDQTLTADETSLGLRVFNDLVEDWSTQDLAVWAQANQTFSTVVGQAVYTIGTGGNWNTTRPINIEPVAYSTINTVSFPCMQMTQEQYNLIAVKTQPQEYPDRFLYVNDDPLGLVTLWPVPNAVTPITFSIDRVLSQTASAGTTVSFPPGFAKAFKYALAVELAPNFGKSISKFPDVLAISRETFGHIKRANRKRSIMRYDPAYLGDAGDWGNWQRGW